jgi:hypothetical protein
LKNHSLSRLLVVLVLAASACADIPIDDVSKTFAIEVSEKSKNEGAIKLDLLWVIDNSASMCQEQFALSQSFGQFEQNLTKYLKNIDIRLAVTTTDAIENAGAFVNNPAETFPPACFETRVHACLGHQDCVKKYGAGWECKDYQATQMYNLNCSVNSQCIFRCEDDSVCCEEFCQDEFTADCKGKDLESCLQGVCKEDEGNKCDFTCRQPGQTVSSSGCLRPPDTADCKKANPPKVLTNKTLKWFKCNATVEPEQSYQANIEQGLKAAWLALDPKGINSDQALSFLREDAYLIIVFVTDEDDCSIDNEFTSPNFGCETDVDCPKGSKCVVDWYFSQLMQKKMRVCSGAVKKDYYNVCSLLGDYKGEAHHSCAYDLSCSDCSEDSDCDYGWYCKQGKKCRPYIYNLTNIASYQSPPGTPVFALSPVANYYSFFRSLKSDPAKVLAAFIVGDGVPVAPKKNGDDCGSLISDECLGDEKLVRCQAYAEMQGTASDACIKDPCAAGCEEFCEAKKLCIRECYIASKGNAKSPTVAKNSYICESEYGKADFGSRYVQLAEMFGPNGIMSNICAEDGIAPALDSIAELVIKRVTKICLPNQVKTSDMACGTDADCKIKDDGATGGYRTGKCGEMTKFCMFNCSEDRDCESLGMMCRVATGFCEVPLKVTMSTTKDDGTMEIKELLEGEPGSGDYRVEYPTRDCCFPDSEGNCTGTSEAITFNEVVDPDALIEIKYASQ